VNLCTKCAQHELTCCQGTEVFVTDGDIRRIAAYTGRVDFWEYQKPRQAVYLMHQPADPNWLCYTVRPDGTRPQLKHLRSGDCTFLTSTGCSLPSEVRPLICRLYPYDYTEHGVAGTVAGCPTYLLEKDQGLLAGIGLDIKDATRWHKQLYSELRAGSIWYENRHHVRSAS
jgi:Fe-S-cluster containining protein